MKILIGFLLGVSVVLLAGQVTQQNRLEIFGTFEKVGIFQPTFSGINNDGYCYFAVTNSITGKSEIFAISNKTRAKMSTEKPFQVTPQEGVLVVLSQQ
jgi:hypothetical protein